LAEDKSSASSPLGRSSFQAKACAPAMEGDVLVEVQDVAFGGRLLSVIRTSPDYGHDCHGAGGSSRLQMPESSTGHEQQPMPEWRTTVMLSNLPEGLSRGFLEKLFDREGFAAKYTFIFIPSRLSAKVHFCYAFVDLVMPATAERFHRHFHGFDRWIGTCEKPVDVQWADNLQGLPALVERYRNSPLMHESVDDCHRPAIYRNGIRVPFPAPTTMVKHPRIRKNSPRKIIRLPGGCSALPMC